MTTTTTMPGDNESDHDSDDDALSDKPNMMKMP